MERNQEEQVRKMKELQSHVERLQGENDRLWTQIGEIHELGRVIINKLSLKHSLSMFVKAHFQSLDKTNILLALIKV